MQSSARGLDGVFDFGAASRNFRFEFIAVVRGPFLAETKVAWTSFVVYFERFSFLSSVEGCGSRESDGPAMSTNFVRCLALE